MTSPQTPAGWYPDPEGSHQQRYWDGSQWTQHYAAPAPAAAAGMPAAGYVVAQKTPPGPAPSLWWAVPALAVLALIGAAGRWVSADFQGQTINKTNGLEGDGSIVLILVIIATVVLIVWRQSAQTWSAVVGAVAAGIATILPLIYIASPSTGAEGFLVDSADWSTGWGAYLAFIACLALTIVSVMLAAATKKRRPA